MFRLSLTNLRRQKLRATLTIMGVMVGTAMVTTMVSVGIGVKRSIIAPLSKSEILTSITVRPFAINLSDFSLRDIGRRPERGPRERKIINDDTISALRKIPGVTTVYPNLRVPLTVQVGDNIIYKDGRMTAFDHPNVQKILAKYPNRPGVEPGLW